MPFGSSFFGGSRGVVEQSPLDQFSGGRLQHRDARVRAGRVIGGIKRMRRRTFRVSLRQKVAAKLSVGDAMDAIFTASPGATSTSRARPATHTLPLTEMFRGPKRLSLKTLRPDGA